MNSYQQEQVQTLFQVQRYLADISADKRQTLLSQIADYLEFRQEVDSFLGEYFSNLCTQKCYQSKRSACCSRDGIITFFGDVVINTLVSTDDQIEILTAAIQEPYDRFKCIYLGRQGCLWQVKPIVCEMFLCKTAAKEVFGQEPEASEIWKEFKRRRKLFTWPDRPVLFDDLERYFIDAGYSSPLMYLHNSPGLLRVKQQGKKRLSDSD